MIFSKLFKKTICFVTALFIAALSGCADVADTENPDDTIPVYTLPPIVKEDVPAAGGELTFPIPQNPASLNPLKTKNVGLYNLFSLIYEAPIRVDTNGYVQPELAETWEVDETGLIWTFKLREGVNWQHGYGELTSADIIYTALLLKSYTAKDSNYAYRNGNVASLEAADKYTVKLTLNKPGNAAVYYMTFPVLCRAYCVTANVDTARPVGTGPYYVESFNMMESVKLCANETWWKQQPYIKSLNAICYPNHDFELAAYKQNLIDFLTTSILTVDTYHKYGEKHYVDYLTMYYDCLVPNTRGLFADANLRVAVAHSLDKRDIVAKGLLGHAVVTDYPVSPDSFLSPGPSKIFEFNQQKAIELLELSGYKRAGSYPIAKRTEGDQTYDLSFELLICSNEPYCRVVAENIAAQLLQCGMDVKIVEADAKEHKSRLAAGNFDIALCSFYLDINPDISYLVGSGGDINYGKFSDGELDSLLDNCRRAPDEPSIKQAYSDMEDRFLAVMPHIGLYYKTNALLYDSDINISEKFRDRNVFLKIPQWYLYVEGEERNGNNNNQHSEPDS
ncbi:MAG: ABC transporter substrate-binding protein [Christensenellales bacterium]